MQNANRLVLFLFIFFLFSGCSQHVVKQEKYDLNGKAQIENKAETAENLSQTTPESDVAVSDVVENEGNGGTDSSLEAGGTTSYGPEEEDVFTDNVEEFEDDEEVFEEFEDEFGGDEIAEVYDPFSGYNRAMTGFNDKLYFWVVKPVAKGYRWILPEFARRGINNFFDNLRYPVHVVNNLLQLKLKNAGVETVRFVTNSTIGVLGLWDPAKVWFGLEARPEDFGQTLGHWGVGAGPHIVLPVLGPSNLRDALALAPDWIYLDPINNLTRVSEWANLDPLTESERMKLSIGIWTFKKLNYSSLHIGEYENLKKDAVDFYTFMRDIYEQNRQKEIEE